MIHAHGINNHGGNIKCTNDVESTSHSNIQTNIYIYEF